MHIVRAPWDVFRSQLRLGWLQASKVPAGRTLHEFYADKICQQILDTHKTAMTSLVPNQSYLVIKYEDFVTSFDTEVAPCHHVSFECSMHAGGAAV